MNKRGITRIQQPYNGIQFVVDREVRNELKPIVFFDAGKFSREDDGFTINFHPHSGIGIITFFHGTDLHHIDSGNNNGVIKDGGAQWIQAGKGVWHEEGYHRKAEGPEKGQWTGSIHQLWIQLPPEQEESEASYANITKEDIPKKDNVKILTGEYMGVSGAFHTPINMTYLDVSLEANEKWVYQTPAGQTTGFIFTRDGEIDIQGEQLGTGQMGILEHNEGEIEVMAKASTSFILVIAEPSQWPILTQAGQIHTNRDSMERSLEQIQRIQKTLVY